MQFDYFSSQISTTIPLNTTSQSWIELSRSALGHNAQQLKTLLGMHTKLAFVVKANAYGHGIKEMSILANQIPEIDILCTFSLSEALTIRSVHVTKPIIVLAHIDHDPAVAIGADIAFVVDNETTIESLAHVARSHNASIPVHLKIDTGLSRFGICPTRALSIAKKIAACPDLVLQGLLTHLSESQEQDSPFTTQQLDLFDSVINQLHRNKIFPPLIHATNSGASLQNMQRATCNLARIGLGLYGFMPATHISNKLAQTNPTLYLKPILTWKTTIMSIKEVPANSYISYNRTHQVVRDTRLAIIPVGYSNGLDVNLSNKGYVLVDNKPVPILGRVAMNVTILDITDLPETVSIGTTVTLLGSDPAVRADRYINLLEIKNVRTLLTCLPTNIPRTIVD